jgi:hypothetical protein
MSKQGKGARKRSKQYRLERRLAEKRMKRAAWDAAKKAGSNGKESRAEKPRKTRLGDMKPVEHGRYNCGNLACVKCYPYYPPLAPWVNPKHVI